MNRKGSSSKHNRAVLLPIDMGNYGRNSLQPKEIFERLHIHSEAVQFLAYHWRRSGNFVFVDSGEKTRQGALEAGEAVTRLPCLIRTFSDLEKVDQVVPSQAQTTIRGAVVLPTPTGPKKLIHVALSQEVFEAARKIGTINDTRVKVLAWPTPQDVLCLYDRPARGGNAGYATNKVLAVCRPTHPHLYGTGRALSVIRDLLADRNMRYG